MPYTLKKNKFKYKNPDTGNYEGVDVVAERSFADYQSALETVGLQQQTVVRSEGTTQKNAVTAAGTAAVANFPATAAACDTLAGDFAATYVPDQAYAVGDYCTYQYQLYQCKTAIAVNTDHTFVTSHWNLITVTDTINDQVDDLKTQIDENLLDYVEMISPTNWYNPEAITSGIMEVNGSVTQGADYTYTDYIPVKENDVIACFRSGNYNRIYHYRIAVFDKNKNAISAKGSNTSSTADFTIQSGIAYAVVTFKSSTFPTVMKPIIVRDGITPTSYSAYFEPYNIYTKDFLTPDTAQAVSKLTDGTIPAQIQQNSTNISNLQTAVNNKASADALVTEISRATAAESRKVNIPLNEHNLPDNGTDGQLLRSKGDGSTEWAAYGEPTQNQVDSAVEKALEAHSAWRSTVDDGSLTDTKFSNTLKLQTIKEYYTPEMYGAVGDGSTDDKLAIESMFADVPDNALCLFYKDYYISDGITIIRPVNIIMYGTLNVAATADFCLRISGNDVRKNHFRLNLKVSGAANQWNGTHNTIGLDCFATLENTFDISCMSFQTGVRLISTNLDCTYNKFFIRYIYNCKNAIVLTGDAELTGGTTAQNTFIGGRIGVQISSYTWLSEQDTNDAYYAVKSILVGKRTNNNNNFISCSFEGFGTQESPYNNRARVSADLIYCVFLGCRFEGITQFESQDRCVVISGYGFSRIANKIGNCTKIGIPNAVGNMKFENGRPQWYDGSHWVYADGTVVG